MQCNLVKVIPSPPGGLNEDARSLVEQVGLSFDARRLLKQSLLIHNARIRIDQPALLLGVGRRGKSNEAGNRNRAKDRMCSVESTRHHPSPYRNGSPTRWRCLVR